MEDVSAIIILFTYLWAKEFYEQTKDVSATTTLFI